MKLSLTKVKVHPDMSEETNCFSATICLEGKVVGSVKNDGRGGCNFYHWEDYSLGRQIENYAKSLPSKPYDEDGELYEMNLDRLINELVDKEDELSQLRRWCKKNTQTVFRLKGEKKGSWQIFKIPYNAVSKAKLLATHGDKIDRIANEEI